MTGLWTRPLSAIAIAALLLGACARSPPTRFFAIDALAPDQISAPTPAPLAVRILAVRLPAALDRLEVAWPNGSSRISVNDLDRWSATPGTLAREALIGDLIQRAPNLIIVPDRAGAPPLTRDLSVTLLSFERRGPVLQTTAVVTIVSPQARPVEVWTIALATPMTRSDATTTAEALSRLIAELADRLAARLASAP